jgi:predicted transport protein
MRKTTNKKKPPQKKAKVVLKKNAKSESDNKAKIAKKIKFPAWTNPKHLQKKDHLDLKIFYELYSKQEYKKALEFASHLDTIVRDVIPLEIWKEIGGDLTSEGKEELQKIEKKKGKQTSPSQGETADDKPEPVEIKIKSVQELEQLIVVNSKTLFGEQAFFFKDKKEVRDEHFPDKFLIDFSNIEKPKLYLIETVLADQSFGQYFARITHFFYMFRKRNNQNDLVWKLREIISQHKAQEKELQERLPKSVEISEFIASLFDNHPIVLLVSNGERSELSMLAETYMETWGRMMKIFIIRLYSREDEEPYPVAPAFEEITKSSKAKGIVRCTEEDHLNAASETSSNIYKEIKAALLKADKNIEFNAKKIYISLRKGKNLAFFHLRKKISLVVMNPEADTRKQIKHHEIKSLPESVQKFWNGPSCTIILENSANLDEVINLLKKMIAKV